MFECVLSCVWGSRKKPTRSTRSAQGAAPPPGAPRDVATQDRGPKTVHGHGYTNDYALNDDNLGDTKPQDEPPTLKRLRFGAGTNSSVSSLRQAVLSFNMNDRPEDDVQKLDTVPEYFQAPLPLSTSPQRGILRNKPTTVAIDHRAYPHIFDAILSYVPVTAYVRLRGVSKALLAYTSTKTYTHIWVRPRGDDIEVEFSFPDTLPPVRIPGLRYKPGKCDATVKNTLARLKKYTRALDVDLSTHPDHWEWAWGNGALAEALSEVRVVRRLELRHTNPRDTFIDGWGLTEDDEYIPQMRFDTEVSFLHINPDGGRRNELLSKLPVRITRRGTTSTVIAFYLHAGCPAVCNLPMPLSVASKVDNLVILLLPPPQGRASASKPKPRLSLDRECSHSLGVLNPILKAIVDGLFWTDRCPEARISIGPMEFLSNEDLHLELDDGVTAEQRNVIIRQEFERKFQQPLYIDQFAKKIQLLSLAEMQAKIGAREWEWVTVSPEAHVRAMSA
ncbi:hypothetical protein Q8F55_009214 [Vanrija albida]|uniref:F-box domain-containing protein n=1 Tax=Vanrija albida TaxID=181172 RepID=A0ABR3PT73_9TREE